MTDAHRVAARFVLCCWLAGAFIGAVVSVVRESRDPASRSR